MMDDIGSPVVREGTGAGAAFRAFAARHAPRGVYPPDWNRRLAEAGYVVPHWPRPWGLDATPAEQLEIDEVVRELRVPRPMNPIGIGWAGPTLLVAGSDEQRARWLPGILDGSQIWCQLFSEPEAGSDLAGLATKAVRDGDEFVVNGHKVWTTLAHIARFGILLARTDPDAPAHAGISCFVLDMHAPGIEVRPIRQITGESDFNEVFFDSVPVPESDRIGAEGEGWAVAVTTLLAERVGLTAGEGTLWGNGPRFADVLDLWRRRRDAGLLPDGAERDVLRHELARLAIESEAIRLTGLRLLSAAARGDTPLTMISVRKLASDVFGQEVHDAVWRLIGADAQLTPESGRAVDGGAWQRSFLFARALTIGGGTTEVQRTILARRILGLPAR